MPIVNNLIMIIIIIKIIIIILIIIIISVIPVVVGALGSITKKLNEWLEKLELAVNIVLLQKTTLLGTARILRKVLEY